MDEMTIHIYDISAAGEFFHHMGIPNFVENGFGHGKSITYNGSPMKRRATQEVRVGRVGVGGSNPIRIQSMTISDTLQTDAVVDEITGLADAGCEFVRVTTQSLPHAKNLKNIREGLDARKIDIPLVADIHFSPPTALEAAEWADKVRVNPGNFVDPKQFKQREYTDAEYAEELTRIEKAFSPFVEKLKTKRRALRIGTNHGSLSDRIMNRYGDTPLGMVECALEYARIAEKFNFHDIIFSMKASNPKIMIQAYRLLWEKQTAEGMSYPIHLGVTEAGDGIDARLKSALGIGTLLEEGIGDTIRVSLTEPSVAEIPVARAIIKATQNDYEALQITSDWKSRRETERVQLENGSVGFGKTIAVLDKEVFAQIVEIEKADSLDTAAIDAQKPVAVFVSGPENEHRPEVLAKELYAASRKAAEKGLSFIPGFRLSGASRTLRVYRAFVDLLEKEKWPIPVVLSIRETGMEEVDAVSAAVGLGSLLCNGIGDAILLNDSDLSFRLLQASAARITRAEFVACPSCGRTLFDLQETTQKVRSFTHHLKGVKIAIMGCIVNGPGEMADADFGYVGAAPGKVSLYVGKECIEKNIAQEDAPQRLIDLIKSNGKWVEPGVVTASANTAASL